MTDEIQKEPQELPEETEHKEKGILIIFRFILVPLLIVGIVVFIVVLFGNMALKEKGVRDYLYDIRTGSQSERWQAAFQLANLMANPKKDYRSEARQQLPDIILIFEGAAGKDPEIRRYLALTMGSLQDPRAVPALQKAMDDDDSQTVINSIYAIGSIGDKGSVPLILSKLDNTDAGIRMMSVYVLGALQDERAIGPLQGLLEDSSEEVSWNAAIALARMGNGAGSDLLLKMMSRDYLAGFPNMNNQNKEELMINAITAAHKLKNPDLDAKIKQLSTSDPNPRVRDTAIKTLR